MATDPIVVRCEGSGCLVHYPESTWGICPMCGKWVRPVNGNAPDHDRNDIVAMLNRGDFDPGPLLACGHPDTTPDVHHDHQGQPSCFECCDTCTPGQGT